MTGILSSVLGAWVLGSATSCHSLSDTTPAAVPPPQVIRSTWLHFGDIVAIGELPSRGLLVYAASEGALVFLDDQTLSVERTYSTGNRLRCMAVTPDEQAIVFGDDEGHVRLLSMGNWEETLIGSHQGLVTSVLAARGGPGPAIYSAADDGTVRRWDYAAGVSSTLCDRGREQPVSALAMTGDLLLCGDLHGNLDIWSVSAERRVESYHLWGYSILSALFVGDGSEVAVTVGQCRNVVLLQRGGFGHVSWTAWGTGAFGHSLAEVECQNVPYVASVVGNEIHFLALDSGHVAAQYSAESLVTSLACVGGGDLAFATIRGRFAVLRLTPEGASSLTIPGLLASEDSRAVIIGSTL
jgi:hypothetical protein